MGSDRWWKAMLDNKTLFLIFLNLFIVNTNELKEYNMKYGKYALRINNLQLCKGVKSKNCSEIKLEYDKDGPFHFEMFFKKPVRLTKGKIIAKVNGKKFVRFQMKNPCDHLLLREFFMKVLNMTRDCTFPEGRRKYNYDMFSIFQLYYGESFVFGNWTFETLLLSESCNIVCCHLDVTLFPKP